MIIPFLIYFLLEDLAQKLVKRYRATHPAKARREKGEREYLRSA